MRTDQLGPVLRSVNVARSRPNPWKTTTVTGIDKRPVDGPVAVAAPGGPDGTDGVGLAGDFVGDVKHHGGDDQAVYAYAREDLDRWQELIGRPLSDGTFGENLTTAGLEVSDAVIGERWRIGADVLLEVSCPRIPCGTFQGWMEEMGWIKRFTLAAVPGAYLRVVEPGEIRAGDSVTVEYRPTAHQVTVATTVRALTTAPELLPGLLDAPELPAEIHERARARAPFD
jgi:MOSC domain-containing protein YiiM